LVNPSSGAKLGSLSSAKISILDDDKQEDDASFSTGLLIVKEGETIKLTIERKGDLNGEVTIDYLVTDGTAGSGDVSSTQGRVTFKSGESSATIEIPVVADNVEEAEEYLYVLLHNPSTGLSVGDVSTVIVVIENAVVVQASSGGGSSRSESASQSSGSSDSAAVVTSLSNVLIDKSTEDKNVQPQTIEAYYSHI
ncbi:Adhesion G-protein coupled receptor V1 like protein, partial [Aduncisulcus paluster]